jgi:hypothetical protein
LFFISRNDRKGAVNAALCYDLRCAAASLCTLRETKLLSSDMQLKGATQGTML